MFEKALAEKLQKIFPLSKVRFDEPSEAKEQEGIFVTVESSVSKITEKKARAKATGYLSIFANSEKLPFGFFNKRISAMGSDAKEIFFYNIDQNAKYFGNLVERRCYFVYFFETQFDPDTGLISSINLAEA